MPKNRLTQTSFTAGVLDARMLARADLQGTYDKGMQEGTNVLSIPYGGLSKRIGTRYVDNLPSGTKRLLRFQFNNEETYLFVMVATRIYIYRNGALITNINNSGNNYLTVPYTAAQLPDVDYVQSSDTMFLVHGDVAPRTIVRGNAHNLWTISTLTFEVQPTNDFGTTSYAGTTFTVTDGGDFGSKTLTASTSVFTSAHVGGSFRTIDGYARITAYSSGTSVTINILKDLDSLVQDGDSPDTVMFSGQTVSLEEPAFSSTHGYPRSVTLHENRLWFGGTESLPQTMWGSNTKRFYNFEIGEGLADEALNLRLDTDEVNAINHMVPGRYLQIFTSGATFYIRTSQNGPITPEDNAATKTETYGSKSTVKPVTIESQTLYVDRAQDHVRAFAYDFSQDSFSNDTVSLRAPDLIKNPVDIESFSSFGREEGNYALIVNDDGGIACLNILSREQIKAWTTIEFADGVSATNVRSVGEDVYLVLNGVDSEDDLLVVFQEDTYTDANVVFENYDSDVVTGLERFNNQTVQVVVDGTVHQPLVVEDGRITLDYAANKVEVGLGYNVNVKMMPVVGGDGVGATLLEQKRVTQVEIMLSEETLGLIINGRRQPDRNFGSMVFNQGPNSRHQFRRTPVLGYKRINSTEFGQTDPLPWQILAVVQQVDT